MELKLSSEPVFLMLEKPQLQKKLTKNVKNLKDKKRLANSKLVDSSSNQKPREIKVKFNLKNETSDDIKLSETTNKKPADSKPMKSLHKKPKPDNSIVSPTNVVGGAKKEKAGELNGDSKKKKLQLNLDASDGENSEDDIANHVFSEDEDDELVDDFGEMEQDEDEEEEDEEEDDEEDDDEEDDEEEDDDDDEIESNENLKPSKNEQDLDELEETDETNMEAEEDDVFFLKKTYFF